MLTLLWRIAVEAFTGSGEPPVTPVITDFAVVQTVERFAVVRDTERFAVVPDRSSRVTRNGDL